MLPKAAKIQHTYINLLHPIGKLGVELTNHDMKARMNIDNSNNGDKPKDFFTMNGAAVPIFEGQTKEEAANNFIEEKAVGIAKRRLRLSRTKGSYLMLRKSATA